MNILNFFNKIAPIRWFVNAYNNYHENLKIFTIYQRNTSQLKNSKEESQELTQQLTVLPNQITNDCFNQIIEDSEKLIEHRNKFPQIIIKINDAINYAKFEQELNNGFLSKETCERLKKIKCLLSKISEQTNVQDNSYLGIFWRIHSVLYKIFTFRNKNYPLKIQVENLKSEMKSIESHICKKIENKLETNKTLIFQWFNDAWVSADLLEDDEKINSRVSLLKSVGEKFPEFAISKTIELYNHYEINEKESLAIIEKLLCGKMELIVENLYDIKCSMELTQNKQNIINLIIISYFIREGMSNEDVYLVLNKIFNYVNDESGVLCLAQSLIYKKMTGDDIIYLFKSLSNISKEEITGIIKAVNPFIRENLFIHEIGDIIEATSLVFKDKGSPFIHEYMLHQDVFNILKVLSEISKEERLEVLEATSSFIVNHMNGKDISSILKAIAKIPKEERTEVLQGVKQFTHENLWDYEIITIINVIATIPREERTEVLENTQLFTRENTRAHGVIAILKTLFEIPKEERTEVLEATKPFIHENMSVREIASLLKIIGKIPKQERNEILKDTKPFIHENMQAHEIVAILKAILAIPQEDRMEVLQEAKIFICENPWGNGISQTIKAIANIPKEERTKVLEATKAFIRQNLRRYQITDILEAILAIPQEERTRVLEAIQPFIHENMQAREIVYILNTIAKMPNNGRIEGLKAAEAFISQNLSGYQIIDILEAIFTIPQEDRMEVLQEAKVFIRENAWGDEIIQTIRAIAKIPKEQRTKILEAAKQFIHETTTTHQMLSCLKTISTMSTELIEERDIQRAILVKITKLIETADPRNTPQINSIIELAMRFAVLHSISNEDPWMQEIIVIQVSIAEPNDPDNMYFIHKTLLEKKKESIDLTIQIQEEFFLVDLESLLHKEKEKSITYSELPTVDATIFSTLFTNLEERVNNVSELVSEWGDYNTMKEMLTSNIREVQKLLAVRGALTDLASQSVVEVYTLTKAIENASTQMEQEGVFTHQERLLLGLAASINNCSTGQKEGIHAAYKLLPSQEIRYVTSEEGDLKTYLQPLISKEIDNIISDSTSPIFRELISNEELEGAISQFVHQSQYLRNLLSDDLGLDHSVKLDLYGACIANSLREKTKNGVLRTLFTYYPLISSVQRHINTYLAEREQKEANAFYNNLTAIKDFNLNWWEVDEDEELQFGKNNLPILSEKGAMEILIGLGVLMRIEI